MKNNVKFWYATGIDQQLDFEGRTHFKEVVVGEGHIIHSEMLMCKQSRDALEKKLKAKGRKVSQVRLQGIKICSECQQAYKQNSDLNWAKWVNPPEPKKTKEIKINPILQGQNNGKVKG